MSVSVVNGYLCFSSCDAAQAKQNKDPQAPPGALPGETDAKHKRPFDRHATILDGALKDLVDAVDASGDTSLANTDTRSNTVDRLA